jgi:hypothetical protein
VLYHRNRLFLMELLNTISGNESNYIEGTIIFFRYNEDNATFEEIKQAAAEANALSFIEKNDFGK